MNQLLVCQLLRRKLLPIHSRRQTMLKLNLPLNRQQLRQHVVVGTSCPRSRLARSGAVRTQALFGWGKPKEKTWEEIEREEQFQIQQEVLARRKNGTWQAEVRERRAKSSRYLRDPEYKKQCDAENRAKFKAQREAEKAANPEPKFGIIIPMAPFGMPEYDGGERFDLRLPHVDQGWVDEDADFFKNIGKLFGGGKKDQNKSQPPSPPSKKK